VKHLLEVGLVAWSKSVQLNMDSSVIVNSIITKLGCTVFGIG